MFNSPIHLGPIQFDQPQWFIILIPAWLLIIWWGRQSLSGLGTTARRAALLIRLVVVLILLACVARPMWRREAKNVNVVVIHDISESVPKTYQPKVEEFLDQAAVGALPDDELSRLTVARNAIVQALPGPPRDKPDSLNLGSTDATNLAEAVRLALAIAPADTGNRILLISDGNQTADDLLSASLAAKAKGIPIDVMPLRYSHDNEISLERIVAPSTARMGQNINLRVLINSRKPAIGLLSLTVNNTEVDLDPDSPANARRISVAAGLDAVTIPLHLPLAGPQEFKAVFEPLDPGSDSIKDNNQAMAVTFVSSEGRVLVLAPTQEDAAPLLEALQQAKIDAAFRPQSNAPSSSVELASYDAIVMINCQADFFTQEVQEVLKSYVYDLGGGFVMVGGPDAFGAGGWTSSPLAEALPIKLDPPAKRQLPRGALVLIMHSCEMPNGNYWGKKTAESAINNLSRLDYAGIIESAWQSHSWTFPLAVVGNKAAIMRAVNSMNYTDAFSFDQMLQDAYDGLVGVEAGAKHIILISDGDPSFTDPGGLLAKMKSAKISISTILVYPHNGSGSGPEWSNMMRLAKATGGRFYPIINQGDFAQLPSIFIKESSIVKRSLRWEGNPFQPRLTDVLSEPLRGIDALPPINGYIVAADREGLSVISARGKENDPILAHWQFGLGKSIAFTSDAGAAYAKGWPSWDHYKQFWEQHIRWAMRPSGSADIRVATEDLGDSTRIVVDALDANGDRLNFVRFKTRVLGPENSSQLLELRQTGPGRYEGIFDSSKAGAYIANLQYAAPGDNDQPGKQGNVQAAVTRPFAKEFKTLSDNAGLLKVVAERTGGRVLSDDPLQADLWSRANLIMPVAQRPIWIFAAFVGIGLFLFDVAVRRVRIDPRAMAAVARRLLHPARSRGSEQIGSLQQARKRAQEGIKQRADLSAEQKAAAIAQAKAAAKADQATAKTKFEIDPAELRKNKTNIALADDQSIADAGKLRVKSRSDAPAPDSTGESGISRLKKAKQRARDELDDDQKQ